MTLIRHRLKIVRDVNTPPHHPQHPAGEHARASAHVNIYNMSTSATCQMLAMKARSSLMKKRPPALARGGNHINNDVDDDDDKNNSSSNSNSANNNNKKNKNKNIQKQKHVQEHEHDRSCSRSKEKLVYSS